MAATTQLPDLTPFAKIATQYGISLRSLREAANRYEFDHIRFGNNLYFKPEQLEAWLELQTRKAKRTTDHRAQTRARVAQERARRAA